MISTKVIVIHIFLLAAAAYKYDILFRDENIFSPCDTPNVKGVDEYLDSSNITSEPLTNGSLYIHGFYELIKDVGSDDNPMWIQIFKKIRGSWVNTIYSMHRRDLCKAIFDPYDVFYKYVKEIAPEERKCPFYKGKIFTIDEASDWTVEIADSRLGGEFKVEVMVNFKELNETFCANVFTEVYKH